MRKQPEVTENIKSIIRDKFAMRPLMSVQNMRSALFTHGYQSVNGGFLDWHYVSKVMQKVRLENIVNINRQDRQARLARLKERHRIVTDHLADIAEGKMAMTDGEKEARYPSPTERIMASNSILKWDMAMFFAEEAVERNIEKPEPIGLVVRKGKISNTKKWAGLIPKVFA